MKKSQHKKINSYIYSYNSQGYYDTMDAGTHYKDGYISVQARADDVINVAGHRIAASSLEEVCKESFMDISCTELVLKVIICHDVKCWYCLIA